MECIQHRDKVQGQHLKMLINLTFFWMKSSMAQTKALPLKKLSKGTFGIH